MSQDSIWEERHKIKEPDKSPIVIHDVKKWIQQIPPIRRIDPRWLMKQEKVQIQKGFGSIDVPEWLKGFYS